MEIERKNLLNPGKKPEKSYVEKCLGKKEGLVIAASDYIRTYVDQIRPYISKSFYSFGTDGYGRSDGRKKLRRFFEVDKVKIRFRPSHFPFTEPSAEVDIGYKIQDGKIKIGEGDKWLEILGCGMVHPNVLKNAKVNPKQYQGYAFGVGIDRLAMLKYGINDLRAFFESDIRWLEFYGFDPLDVPTNYRGLSR